MKARGNYRFNIGGASIILILIVFALTVFAILSIKASYHELKLAQKTKEAVEEYYIADSTAEDLIKEVNTILDANKNKSTYTTELEWFDELKAIEGLKDLWFHNNILSYEVYIGEYGVLQVQLELNDRTDYKNGIEVLSWKMVAHEQSNYGESLNLWEGNTDQ